MQRHGKNYNSAARWRRSGGGANPRQLLIALALVAAIAAAAWLSLRMPADGSAAATSSRVVIRRVMTSNPDACFSVNGKYYDWIELANLSDETVDLTGWRLSDDADLRGAFAFENVAIPAGGSLLVYCADPPEGAAGGTVFTGFKLASDGELLVMADANGQWQQALEVPPLGAAMVWQRRDDGEYEEVSIYDILRRDEEYAQILRPDYDPNGLRINELMSVNRTTRQDEDGDYSDWLELYNASPLDIGHGGWFQC